MRGSWKILFVCFSSILIFSTACSGGAGSTGSGDLTVPPDPPEAYAGKTNPIEGDGGAIKAGEEIYQINCASCHGQTGHGDGPAAGGLSPKPQNLAAREESLSDAYLFWRISEGGGMAPFKSAMPSWKAILSEEQIWQTISYVRTLGE